MPYRTKRRYGSKSRRYGSKSRRRYGSKSVTRRRYSKSSRTRVKIPNKIMPDYTLVKMSDEYIYISPVGNTPANVGDLSYIDSFVYANDLYDAFSPLPVTVGSQPTGFNEWMAFYNRFIVHKSSIKVTPVFWNTQAATTAGQMPFQISITPVTDVAITSATADFSEQPYTKTKRYNAPLTDRQTGGVVVADTGTQTIPSTWNSIMVKKIMGVKDLVDDPDNAGTFISSPQQAIYWAIEVKSLVPAAVASDVYRLSSIGLRIELFSKVQLLDRNTIPRSEDA